jgi:hypothetical protein
VTGSDVPLTDLGLEPCRLIVVRTCKPFLLLVTLNNMTARAEREQGKGKGAVVRRLVLREMRPNSELHNLSRWSGVVGIFTRAESRSEGAIGSQRLEE